jgi:ABC-2 type transport system ATP-binding protein
MSVILKTEKLRVEFTSREFRQTAKVALNGLDLEVNAGEVFGFLGPNGAGKTTTMNVLLGFIPATSSSLFPACPLGASYIIGNIGTNPICPNAIGSGTNTHNAVLK